MVVNAFVGAMVGLERSVLPLLAAEDFGLVSRTAILSFLVSFGLVKAETNYFAGRLSESIGRKPVLVLGWLAALPVPVMIILAPSWGWVVAANVLLGVNQGLAWSTTAIVKIDLVGPARRGLAMILNEAAGYGAVSLAAGYLAASYGVRPAPFLPGAGFAVLGFVLSLSLVRETRGHARTRGAPDGEAGKRAGRQTKRKGGARTNELHLPRPLEREPCGPREQPKRRDGVGPLPALLRRGRSLHRSDQPARRRLPRRLGRLATGWASETARDASG